MRNRVINSTTYLLAAYFIVHFVSLASQYVILKFLSVREVMMYFFYNSYLPPDNGWWTRVKVFLVFGINFFILFVFLGLIVVLFLKLSRKNFRLSIFYNWLIIVTASFILAEIISAPFFGNSSKMYVILLWLRFKAGGGGMYLLAILVLPLIPVVAYFINDPFLKMTNTTKMIKTKMRRVNLFFQTAFIPFFILALLLYVLVYYAYSYPIINALSHEGMRILIMGAILFFGAIFSFNKKYISIQKSNTLHILNVSTSLLVLVSIAAVYVLFWLNLS